MSFGDTGGTWEMRDEGGGEYTVFRVVELPTGVKVPKEEGKIYRGEAVEKRRQEVEGDD